MKKLLLCLLFCFTLPALAVGLPLGDTTINTAVSGSYSGAHADAYARAQAQQAQMQAQRQSQNQGNSQAITVGGQTTTYTSPAETRNIQDGTATLRTVPSVSAPAALPTAPCRISQSAGIAVIGFGGTVGTSIEDEKCTMRENARLLHHLGATEAALLLMCFDDQVAQVLGVCARK